MTKKRTDRMDPHRKWVIATGVSLVLAAVGDAGPEIIESGSLVAGYDGPGPLIYLAFAVLVTTVRWRFTPLLAVVMSAFFLFGGFSSADFTDRLVSPAGVEFVGGWLQILGFAAAIVCGLAAVPWRRSAPAVSTS